MGTLNTLVEDVASPPIAEADSWLAPQHAFPDKPLLNLAQGVPSYPPALALREEIGRLALEPRSARYTPILGLEGLRDGFARHVAEVYSAPLEANRVAITAGCNQAYCTIIQALAGAGDEVILTVPFYFNHDMWLRMQGIDSVYLHCDLDTCLPDVERCESLITSRTRALVLVSPNNPTGAIYPPRLLQRFSDLARRHGITLVLDETYKDFLPGAARPHDLLRDSGWGEHLVSLHSFSKSYSMTGYRVGAMLASPTVLAQVEKILDCVTICPSHLSQGAAEFALRTLDDWRAQRCSELVARADALRSAVARNELRYRLLSAGGYFAYLRHPFDGVSSVTVARHLAAEHNMLCLPGSMFGPRQDAFLRFSFTNVDEDSFPSMVERLIQSQHTLGMV